MIGKGILIVLDAVGIGGAPDAKNYDDQGADTLGNIRKACVKGEANLKRFGKLRIPHLAELGIFASHALANNHYVENNNFFFQKRLHLHVQQKLVRVRIHLQVIGN